MSSAPSLIKPTIVQAGAGTGKTESLANRIIDLAQIVYGQKKSVPRFVATTFTERATAELRERVVSLLSQREGAQDWLTQFVQDTEDLHISTIHGTLSLILHRFGSLLGLDPEFVIVSEIDERDFLSRVLREIFSKHADLAVLLEQYSFSELIDVVRALISHQRLHGPLFQGAIGWEKILDGEAAKLMEALQALRGATLSDLSAKLAEKVTQIGSLLQPIQKAGRDHEKIRSLFLGIVGDMSKPSIKEGARGSELKPAIDFIFSLKQESWSTETYDPAINRRHEEVLDLLTSLVTRASQSLQDLKKEAGVLSFDDLEFLTLELVTKHPEVLYSIRAEWDYWFVDEFQDTSPLQKKLLFQFLKTPWNAFFVGDPQQSIYLFRGADENVFQETKAIVQKNEGILDRLKVNYRSHPDLLQFMNHLFVSMKPPMEILEAREPGRGEIRTEIHLAVGEISEDQLVLNQIREWRSLGHSFHDMAVLVRTNDKARTVARVLGAAGVPVYIHSSGGYYDRREVLDALSLLSFIEDPSDDDTFIILARSPWMGVPDRLLAQWGVSRSKKSYWEILTFDDSKLEEVPSLKVLKQAVLMAETRPLSAVFENLVERLGFLEFCLTGDASGRREANLRKLFWSLRKAEEEPGFSAANFIESAWREFSFAGEESEAASFIEPQRVNIMTIHMSKGLKFSCVVVPNCGNALRPKTNFLETAPDGRWAVRVLATDSEEKVSPLMHVSLREERFERELAESARVFYVAVTRAAERLSLISSQRLEKNSWFGSVDLDLSEGIHGEGYSVKVWTESPVISNFENISDEADIRKINLLSPLNHMATNLTVTRLVQSRFLTRDQKPDPFQVKDQKLAAVPASEPGDGFKEMGASHKETETLGLGQMTFDLGESARVSGPTKVSRRSAKSKKAFSGPTAFEFQLETQQRGQAIHSIFEEYKYNPHIGIRKLCELAKAKFPARLKIDEGLIERALQIEIPPLKNLIQNGRTEWGFMFRERGLTLEGKIDLWGVEKEDVWIVDYKSAESFTQESIEKAKEQLELYALAINRLGHPWEKIKLAVVAPLQRENARILTLSPRADILSRLQPLNVQHWNDFEY